MPTFNEHVRNIGLTSTGFVATALALFVAFMWRDVFNATAETIQEKLEPHHHGKVLHVLVRVGIAVLITIVSAAVYYTINPTKNFSHIVNNE